MSDKKGSLDKEFAKHLHQQHAINENERNGHVIAFIAAIIFAVGAFGYVIYSVGTSNDRKAEDDDIYRFIVIASSACACLILSIISAYNVCMGYTTRRDSMLIQRIREEYSSINELTKYDQFGKRRLDFLLESNKVIFISIQVVILAIAVTLGLFLGITSLLSTCCAIMTAIILLVFVGVNVGVLHYYYGKYKDKDKRVIVFVMERFQ